jgi:hypothetical protein
VNERTLKAIYKAAGWDLIDETYLQTGGLLASFPLTLADGLSRDLMRMRRFRTVLSANVAALARSRANTMAGPSRTCSSSGGAVSPSSGRPSRTMPATTMSRSRASPARANRCCFRT